MDNELPPQKTGNTIPKKHVEMDRQKIQRRKDEKDRNTRRRKKKGNTDKSMRGIDEKNEQEIIKIARNFFCHFEHCKITFCIYNKTC